MLIDRHDVETLFITATLYLGISLGVLYALWVLGAKKRGRFGDKGRRAELITASMYFMPKGTGDIKPPAAPDEAK